MELASIIDQTGRKRPLMPVEVAELVTTKVDPASQVLWFAIHSEGYWSVEVKTPAGLKVALGGTFDNDGFYLS